MLRSSRALGLGGGGGSRAIDCQTASAVRVMDVHGLSPVPRVLRPAQALKSDFGSAGVAGQFWHTSQRNGPKRAPGSLDPKLPAQPRLDMI